MNARNCTCIAFYRQGLPRDAYSVPVGFAWVAQCPAHGRGTAWYKRVGEPAADQLHSDGPLPPKRPIRKSSFVVSPPAQHDFIVLGGERPHGERAAAQAALDKVRSDQEHRAAARRDRAQAKPPR
jgi:hypothetical protein